MNLFEISGHRRNNAACNLLNVKCKVPSCVQNLLTTSRINAATRSHFFNSSILTFKIKPFQIIHTLTRKPFTQRSHTQAEQKKKTFKTTNHESGRFTRRREFKKHWGWMDKHRKKKSKMFSCWVFLLQVETHQQQYRYWQQGGSVPQQYCTSRGRQNRIH